MRYSCLEISVATNAYLNNHALNCSLLVILSDCFNMPAKGYIYELKINVGSIKSRIKPFGDIVLLFCLHLKNTRYEVNSMGYAFVGHHSTLLHSISN